MHQEISCGAVLYTLRDGQYLFVIVQEQSGAYSFPKGHMEACETEMETARREILEETGLKPVFVNGFREIDAYDLREKPGTRKQVIYFLAKCGNETPNPQQGEIRKIVLLPYDQAMQCFEWEGTRRVLMAAYYFLKQL
ncbi:MAG: NUDIX domain-containing protein [Clostridiales bacterium]|nr:NUDIX domain-containing protein [Clostridiales bacterium]